MTEAHLVLADGTRFRGCTAGATGTTVGEVVFTTGMTGYQEVLTDPSYAGQIVTMTAPHIGNTGTTPVDQEAARNHLAGFVMHEIAQRTSSWRSVNSLDDYLRQNGIVAITGIDTRVLTRHIRDHGAQMAAMGSEDPKTLHDRAIAAPPMTGQDLARVVTAPQAYEWTQGSGDWSTGRPRGTRAHIVAIDYGIKHNILRCFVDLGCRVTVVPGHSTAEDVLALSPDGVFLSNGPGDPAAVEYGIQATRGLLGKRPLFGICLGHQILSRALGGTTSKLKFGHRGLNQPVKDLATGRIEITTQNHGFVVDVDSLRDKCKMTHIHLNDGTCEGIEHSDSGAFSVQYHPEASAGPHDARYLFDRFLDRIEAGER